MNKFSILLLNMNVIKNQNDYLDFKIKLMEHKRKNSKKRKQLFKNNKDKKKCITLGKFVIPL